MAKKKLKLKPHFGVTSAILIGVVILLIAADLLTKYFEVKYEWECNIIPGVIQIQGGGRHFNTAAAFGGLDIGQPALIALTFVLLALLITAFILLPERFAVLKTAIAIVISGAIGNLVDRLAFNGVRDWFGLWMFGMTYCNLADFWIVIGVIIAVIDLLFLNEWALIPLTKKAKAAQMKRKAEEAAEKAAEAGTNNSTEIPAVEKESSQTEENAAVPAIQEQLAQEDKDDKNNE